MAFAKRKMTEGKMERRRRLLAILPEVLESLEEQQKDSNLTGKNLKELHAAIRGVSRFLSCLKNHETTHDCHLATVIGSPAIGSMYNAIFGRRDLSSFLEREYALSEEAFRKKEMDMPVVLREIYKKYKRFDNPVDETEALNACSSAPCPASDC